MSRLAVSLSLLAALALPSTASGERVVTRKGEAVEGTARFEKDEVIVEKADGTVVRLKKSDVERIELTDAERAAPEGPPAAVEPPPDVVEPPPEQPEEEDDYRPTYRPRRPPPPAYPPPPPYRPRTPRLRGTKVERSYDKSGGALTLGYHRGLSVGGEWQYRPGSKRSMFGFGLGGQLGVESTYDVAFLTYGATGRFYLGREHRFVSEVGFGLNLIDPYLGTDCGGDPICAEKSHGPEVSLGYQFVSGNGLILEILGGIAVATNQALIDEHGQVAPTFQLSMGYLFH